jgi:PTH1 family peptidyl-tRNA hydrolase
MPFIITGLGNPGEEYAKTRHNTGRIILATLAKHFSFLDFKEDPKIKARISKGEIAGESVTLVEPDNFMNRSGASLVSFISNPKKAKNLIVIYDDLDLPLGKIKISFNKSSGGHRGLDSIIKNLKTQEFIRIRVGISPTTPSGKIKKPDGADAVEKHIIGDFKKPELDQIKKVSKTVVEAVEIIIKEGLEKAMGEFN